MKIRRMKPLLPSLRERKRYLVFEVLADKKIDFENVAETIWQDSLEFLGKREFAKAGVLLLKNEWDFKKQKGIVKVNNKHVDDLRMSLALVEAIKNQKVIIRTIGLSGVLKKAKNKFIGG